MEKPKQTKGLPGFYIALCCCVMAIGLAGFLSQNSNTADEAEFTAKTENNVPDREEYEPPRAAEAEKELPLAEPPVTADAEQAASIDEYAIDNPDVEAASVTVNAADGGAMQSPVPPGEVISGFSGDTLRYNDVLCDWRVHSGVDIAADVGCSVSAAADGTVTDVGSGSYGNYVAIDHGKGISAIYAQLADVNVAVGDAVKAGSVIGTIAKSRGEGTGASHLHYEILKDGKYVDPEEY